MSRSNILVMIAVGIVAVVAGVLFWRASGTERPRDQPRPREMAQEMPTVDAPAATPLPPKRDVRPPREAAQLDSKETAPTANPNPPSETPKVTAADLRYQARFPPNSRRIEDDIDPIVRARVVKEQLSPPGQGRKPTLVVTVSALSYEAPNPIIIYAKFIRDSGTWVPRADAEIAGELRNAADEVVAQVDLHDDGQDRDIEANDGVFTAELSPAPEDMDRWKGLIRVEVYGETSDGDHRSAKTHFYYGAPAAKLTGNYKDQLVAGHLEIEAEVDVRESGQFRLEASLGGTHSGSQDLIAWAQNTVQLDPGIHWMPVTFWGLTLREKNEPGPYHLASVALANVSQDPPQLNDATGTNYQTAPYRAEDFSDASYNDPQLLDRAARMEAGK